jgi:hypothetical protein
MGIDVLGFLFILFFFHIHSPFYYFPFLLALCKDVVTPKYFAKATIGTTLSFLRDPFVFFWL